MHRAASALFGVALAGLGAAEVRAKPAERVQPEPACTAALDLVEELDRLFVGRLQEQLPEVARSLALAAAL